MPIDVRKVYRSRKIIGTPVRNKAGEDLGEIEEVVIDLEHNRVAYAVLSFGGFLGLGDKLVAIPCSALSLAFGEDGNRTSGYGSAGIHHQAPAGVPWQDHSHHSFRIQSTWRCPRGF